MSLIDLFYILEVAFGIGLVIFVHELGHFLMARKVGVRVEVFSLGFGPRLFGFSRGDTDYRVSAFPFGGFVKMAGENPSMVGTGAPDEFTSKTVGERSLIAVAGVTMNLITGLIIFCLAFAFGVKFVLPEVGTVLPGLDADVAGLREGDRVVSVNGKPVSHYHQVGLAIAYSDKGEEIEIIVERQVGDEIRTVPITIQPKKDEDAGYPQLRGFTPRLASLVASVDADSAGASAVLASDRSPFPLVRGDLITSVAGVPIDPTNGVPILREIFDHPGEEISITLRRGAEAVTILEREGHHIRPRLEYQGGDAFEVLITPQEERYHTIGAYPKEYPKVMGEIVPGSPAYGILQQGDVILRLQGQDARVLSLRQAIRFSRGRPVDITVKRGEEELDLSFTAKFYGGGAEYMLGVYYASPPVVGKVDPDSPAARAGLMPGDVVVELDGVGLRAEDGAGNHRWQQIEMHFSGKRRAEEASTLTVLRGGEEVDLRILSAPLAEATFGRGGIGFRAPFFSLRSANLLEASQLGIQGTIDWVRNIFLTFRNLINRRVDPRNLGGPVMIAESSYHFATQGFGTILYFLGIISVNLAILNILPIPVLDGGLLFFLLIEKLKGSPVKEKYLIIANYLGLVMLLSLMLYVTYNDIWRLINR